MTLICAFGKITSFTPRKRNTARFIFWHCNFKLLAVFTAHLSFEKHLHSNCTITSNDSTSSLSNRLFPGSSQKYSNGKPSDSHSASLPRNNCECDPPCWYLKTNRENKVEHKGAAIQKQISVWMWRCSVKPEEKVEATWVLWWDSESSLMRWWW